MHPPQLHISDMLWPCSTCALSFLLSSRHLPLFAWAAPCLGGLPLSSCKILVPPSRPVVLPVLQLPPTPRPQGSLFSALQGTLPICLGCSGFWVLSIDCRCPSLKSQGWLRWPHRGGWEPAPRWWVGQAREAERGPELAQGHLARPQTDHLDTTGVRAWGSSHTGQARPGLAGLALWEVMGPPLWKAWGLSPGRGAASPGVPGLAGKGVHPEALSVLG